MKKILNIGSKNCKENLVEVNYQLNCNGCIEVDNNIEGDITPEQLCEQLRILYELGDNYYTIEQKSDIVMNFRDVPTHFLELIYIKGKKFVLGYDLNGSLTIQDATNATNGYLDYSGEIICSNIDEKYLFNTGSDGKYYGVDYCKKLIDTYFK